MNNATLGAITAAARYTVDAAANPPADMPVVISAAIAAGTYTSLAILAAAAAHALNADYEAMLEEFGVDKKHAPPKDAIMAEMPRIMAFARREEVTH